MFKTRSSIKKKILIGFTALIGFFIANVAYIFYTIDNSRYIVTNLFEDKDQSVLLLNDFKDLVLRSKMYSLNWVFQRKDEDGKTILKQLLTEEYPVIKTNFDKSANIWSNKEQLSQINKVLLDFEFLKDSEEEIMQKLSKFTDYEQRLTIFLNPLSFRSLIRYSPKLMTYFCRKKRKNKLLNNAF